MATYRIVVKKQNGETFGTSVTRKRIDSALQQVQKMTYDAVIHQFGCMADATTVVGRKAIVDAEHVNDTGGEFQIGDMRLYFTVSKW